MENTIQVNPVEIIKKDIYIIKNDINNKVYIGQAINTKSRFNSHCKKSSANENSLIDRAIQKYGKEHFYYEILESQIDNYNEREKYWVSKYNCLKPNGYNILEGGNEPPVFYGERNPNSKLTDAQVDCIKDKLRNTKESLREIANQFNISKRQVLRINQGLSRKCKGDEYPLRKEANTSYKLTEEDVEKIIHDLKFTYMFNGEIADKYNVSVHLIDFINAGTSYQKEGEKYPIREWKSCGKIRLTYEQVTEIISRLKTDSISINKLAKEYGVNANTLYIINSGSAKVYRRENEHYPIRPF